MSLPRPRFCVDHQRLLENLNSCDQLLFIQDLDGVCMGLVRDPLDRQLEPRYLAAAKQLQGQFFVLSNGEHIGRRGVNGIVEASLGDACQPKQSGLYLPGLGGGGVQWQDGFGRIEHPGVSDAELAFLRSVPDSCSRFLRSLLSREPFQLSTPVIEQLIETTVLDNLVSPTVNINNFFRHFAQQPQLYLQLQRQLQELMQSLLGEADKAGLAGSFFVHYAPNLGSSAQGERIKYAQGEDSGTTDFQFMLRGAIKEVGVLVILNRYYQQRCGDYPLGQDFNVRQAPSDRQQLLQLVQQHFDPQLMPHIVAVGDTVTSQRVELDGTDQVLRGGSDRGFLTLVQSIGQRFERGHSIVYIDSSGGEVRRPALQPQYLPRPGEVWGDDAWRAVEQISDPDDPLQVDFAFTGGHHQYVDFFCSLAASKAASKAVR